MMAAKFNLLPFQSIQPIVHHPPVVLNDAMMPCHDPIKNPKFTKTNMKSSRAVDLKNPNENIFRFAEGHFHKMIGGARHGLNITSIDVVNNPTLEALFDLQLEMMKAAGRPHEVIFAYHGTRAENIDHILNDNFDNTKIQRVAHGRGHYFSEYPATALNYSSDRRHLIFCKIIPGRQYVGPDHSWPGYDSKLVEPNYEHYSKMVIISNKDQILPLCVINMC